MFYKRIKELEEKNKELEEEKKKLEEEKKKLKSEIKGATFSPIRFIANVNSAINSKDFYSVKYLIKILTEYLTFKEATNCLLREDTHSRYRNNGLYFNLSSLHSLYNIIENSFEYELTSPIKFPINKLNLILDTWCEKRIISNIHNINSQNKLQPDSNIRNIYVYPLDIVICMGGNHSQFSANLKMEGSTRITTILDLSNLYSNLTFNGVEFVDKNDKNDENEKKYISEEAIIIGTLFEIGRLLLKNKEYFDTQIINEIDKHKETDTQ